MTVYIYNGTNADEIIDALDSSASVTSTGPTNETTAQKDEIHAGGGDDHVESGNGNDDVFLDGGDDVFVWDSLSVAGGGNDNVRGGSGFDTINFKGFGDDLEITGNGLHTVISSTGVDVDLKGVEQIRINTASGDGIKVHDLTGTGVEKVVISLAALPTINTPDGTFDGVTVDGTGDADNVKLTASGDRINVKGLAAKVVVDHADNDDQLIVKGFGGNDRIDASAMPSNFDDIELTGDGGADTLIGGKGDDTLIGGTGHDDVQGGKGADLIIGDDPNSANLASDVLKGGGGTDGFWLWATPNSSKADQIVDFKPGVDKIILVSSEFADALGMTVDASEFRIGNKALDADDHLIYNANTGALAFDADGKDGEAAVKFAELAENLNLSEHDFQLLNL